MKKHVFTFLAALATVFIFSHCKKADETRHNTYFWTSATTKEQPLTLFVDGQSVGVLPHFGITLTCSNDTLKQQALFMNLESGKYHLEAKNSQGDVKSDCTLKISDCGMGVGPGTNLNNPGGVTASKEGPVNSSEGSSNSCVIVNLFY